MRIGPFGIWEILIILVIVLLVFGPRRLPEMAKGLGQSVRAFRKELRDMKSDLDLDERPEPASGARSAASTAAAAPPAEAPREDPPKGAPKGGDANA